LLYLNQKKRIIFKYNIKENMKILRYFNFLRENFDNIEDFANDPRYDYRPPEISYDSNTYRDDNYNRGDYLRDLSSNIVYQDIDRYDPKYLEDDNQIWSNIGYTGKGYEGDNPFFNNSNSQKPWKNLHKRHRKRKDPVISDPVISDPVIPDPVVPDPVVSDPVVSDPVVSDPVNDKCNNNIFDLSNCHKELKMLIWCLIFFSIIFIVAFVIYTIFGNKDTSPSTDNHVEPVEYVQAKEELNSTQNKGFLTRMFNNEDSLKTNKDATDIIPTETVVQKTDEKQGFLGRMFGSEKTNKNEATKVVEKAEIAVPVEAALPAKAALPTVEKTDQKQGFLSRMFGSDKANENEATKVVEKAEVAVPAVPAAPAKPAKPAKAAKAAKPAEAAEASEAAKAAETAVEKTDQKQGFLSRMFGSDKANTSKKVAFNLSDSDSSEIKPKKVMRKATPKPKATDSFESNIFASDLNDLENEEHYSSSFEKVYDSKEPINVKKINGKVSRNNKIY